MTDRSGGTRHHLFFSAGSDACDHSWSPEQQERDIDYRAWWRSCTLCGERRTTRTFRRGPAIEIYDVVHNVRYVIGSQHNRADREFRYLHCACGNSIQVAFDVDDHARVTRRFAVKCERCGEKFSAGTSGPDSRPKSALWLDAAEIDE